MLKGAGFGSEVTRVSSHGSGGVLIIVIELAVMGFQRGGVLNASVRTRLEGTSGFSLSDHSYKAFYSGCGPDLSARLQSYAFCLLALDLCLVSASVPPLLPPLSV